MFLVINRNKLIALAIVLILSLLVCVALGVTATTTDVFERRLIPIYSVETDNNKVALTFDCAWGSEKTRAIMDMVEQAGYKCTFFMTGFWINENQELVKEIHSRGHQLANHSENHPHLSKESAEVLMREIDGVNDKIEALTGIKPTCFRAPFGEYDNKMIKSLEERDMLCIQWSIDSLDWKGITGKEIAERVIKRLQRGDIVLFHNNSEHVLDALPLVLSVVKNKGLSAVRVDELVYFEGYTINSEGKQIKNS